MDIFVSHLNHRMALQLPAEFPLGLVFVVGSIERFLQRGGNGEGISFYLSEGDHRIRCRLSSRHTDGIELNQGDLIRAGGHLAFDTAQADYYLLARDIEVLDEYRPSRTSLSEIIADAQKRTQVERVSPEQLPEWVKKIAPPELIANWQRQGLEYPDQEEEDGITQPEILATARGDLSYPAHEPALAQLSDELIEFLSEAMDSEDEVEITAELLGTVDANGQLAEQELDAFNQGAAASPESPDVTTADLFPRAQDGDDISSEYLAGSSEGGDKSGDETVPWYFVAAVLLLFAGFSAVIIYTLINQLS